MLDSEDIRNALNSWFNPFHTLFIPYQAWKRFWYRKLFDSIEKNPLTKKQRRGIILDERRALVVAGAGTGKTSTVVGKIGYLLKSKKAKPEEILVIAYNRAAANELEGRIKNRIKKEVEVGTFHSIGRQILTKAKHPKRVSPFVEQTEAYRSFLQNSLENSLKHKKIKELFKSYFLEYEYPERDEHKDFKSLTEYASWVRRNYFLTLNRERVKSYGEIQIANFLLARGIDYQYEPTYSPYAQKSQSRKGKLIRAYPAYSLQTEELPSIIYKPDFYIPSINAYIEYFGIDKEGNTAPYIDAEAYKQQMQWKIELHQKEGTDLIQLFYHQNRDGILLQSLKEELLKRGAKFQFIPLEVILQKINEAEKYPIFIDLVDRFLTQLKENSNNISIAMLKDVDNLDERTLTFLGIFEEIYHSYQNELKNEKHIDFGDMISTAAKIVKDNKFASKWKYIIVDEFQDISQGRFDLINVLLAQNKKTKLFCVGDDWQAIYRFAGSDHQIMSKFRSIVGESTRVKLDTTFRFNNKIAKVSEQFVTKNPSQIKKVLKTLFERNKDEPQIFLHWTDQDTPDAVKKIVSEIAKNNKTKNKSLQILARYNQSKVRLNDSFCGNLKSIWKGEILRPRTIHAAKGLEADYVIVVDLNSYKNGFPSERENDPILNMVLSHPDYFEHSEERRLFYVALTRAKEQTHLIASAEEQSAFATELDSDEYEHDVTTTGTPETKINCPECADGKIVEKKFSEGSFFGCTNFPLCKYSASKCSVCNSSAIERIEDEEENILAQCMNEDCKEEYKACSACSNGVLVRKTGPYGDFLGCHTFWRTGCKNTQQIEN